MKRGHHREDRRDDGVQSLLRQTAAPTPLDGVDWHALHERIMADAVRVRTTPVRPPAWWEVATRWAAVAVPLGTAAGFVAAVALARIGTVSDVRPSIVSAMQGETPVASVTNGLVAPDAERWVVAALVGE